MFRASFFLVWDISASGYSYDIKIKGFLDITIEFILINKAYLGKWNFQGIKRITSNPHYASIFPGMTVMRIINEPTAAAIAYGLDKKEGTQFFVPKLFLLNGYFNGIFPI